LLLECCYALAPFVGPRYLHHRSIFGGDHWWIVRDTVEGHNGAPVRSRLHLHPAVDPSLDSTGRVRLTVGDEVGFVHPLGATRISITTGQYFPRFGVATDRPVIELHAGETDSGSATIGALLTRRNLDALIVGTASDGDRLTSLRLDGEEYRLPEEQLSLK
jgi:hypothetical protein